MVRCSSGFAGREDRDAKPSPREEKTYNEVKVVLDNNETIMKLIVEYKGCKELCRQAMKEQNEDAEREAFEGLLRTIESIQAIHHHSENITVAGKLLLQSLGKEDTKQTLEDQQALVKQLGDLLVFTIDFDQKRLMCAQLSNDFAFYRRLLPKFPRHPDVKVKAEEASSMALFTALNFPMIKALVSAAEDTMRTNDKILPMIGTMANACLNMLAKKNFEKKDTNLFLAKAMTGAIVLYDHCAEMGVFNRATFFRCPVCILTPSLADKGCYQAPEKGLSRPSVPAKRHSILHEALPRRLLKSSKTKATSITSRSLAAKRSFSHAIAGDRICTLRTS
eukprot:738824-Amorphochlora_amoeboformis.AAC.2